MLRSRPRRLKRIRKLTTLREENDENAVIKKKPSIMNAKCMSLYRKRKRSLIIREEIEKIEGIEESMNVDMVVQTEEAVDTEVMEAVAADMVMEDINRMTDTGIEDAAVVLVRDQEDTKNITVTMDIEEAIEGEVVEADIIRVIE
eukprot:1047497_1